MPGFLTPAEMRQVKMAPSERFDAVFVETMARHHKGAVTMADQMLRSGGDLRLRIMAHAIRHEQQGEIALMRGLNGVSAVTTAFANMVGDNVNWPWRNLGSASRLTIVVPSFQAIR